MATLEVTAIVRLPVVVANPGFMSAVTVKLLELIAKGVMIPTVETAGVVPLTAASIVKPFEVCVMTVNTPAT